MARLRDLGALLAVADTAVLDLPMTTAAPPSPGQRDQAKAAPDKDETAQRMPGPLVFSTKDAAQRLGVPTCRTARSDHAACSARTTSNRSSRTPIAPRPDGSTGGDRNRTASGRLRPSCAGGGTAAGILTAGDGVPKWTSRSPPVTESSAHEPSASHRIRRRCHTPRPNHHPLVRSYYTGADRTPHRAAPYSPADSLAA